MRSRTPRNYHLLTTLTAIIVVSLALALLAKPNSHCVTDLLFISPQSRAEDCPREWQDPVKLAMYYLEEIDLPVRLSQLVENLPSSSSGGEMWIVSAVEDGRLQLHPVGPYHLRIDFLDSNSELALIYSRASIQYLQQRFSEERESQSLSSPVQEKLLSTENYLVQQESKLTGKSGSTSNDLPDDSLVQYGLRHYREGLTARGLAIRQREFLRCAVMASEPAFVVMSGPTVMPPKIGLATGWAPLLIGLCVLGLASYWLYSGRIHFEGGART